MSQPIPSFKVKTGDKIPISDASRKSPLFVNALEVAQESWPRPGVWLEILDKQNALAIKAPHEPQFHFAVDELIVEYYSR
jgi:ribosomal protein S4